MPILDETFFARLEQAHATDPDAAAYKDAPAMLARFQQRFPAERLRALSGAQLLEELHGRSSLDCLSYWLEFRDKPDFRARLFGSIRGGSALKFGIYQRAEDNAWYEHGGQSGAQRKLSISEAIAIAEAQRDQMLRAREVVARPPEDPALGGYETLQADIEAAAPDLTSLAFLHKYLFLQFPDRLDDFHSTTYHAHHLLWMGYEPRTGGLYTSAGALIEAWREFRRRRDVPLAVFCHLLNLVNGAPFSWWRVGTQGKPELLAGNEGRRLRVDRVARARRSPGGRRRGHGQGGQGGDPRCARQALPQRLAAATRQGDEPNLELFRPHPGGRSRPRRGRPDDPRDRACRGPLPVSRRRGVPPRARRRVALHDAVQVTR